MVLERVTLLGRTRSSRFQFYASKEALEAILALKVIGIEGKEINPFLQKVQSYSNIGFSRWSWVKPEGNQVFRISTTSNGLGRIIGFYDAMDFIAIRYFLKRKHKLGPSERDVIDEVARMKRDRTWTKVDKL